MRGEYKRSIKPSRARWELPPRARRIQNGEVHHPKQQGTTSACAENTLPKTSVDVTDGNYLRVRGEYVKQGLANMGQWELPPRARRIPAVGIDVDLGAGTTSACAENTTTTLVRRVTRWNYLRVRGEYHSVLVWWR